MFYVKRLISPNFCQALYLNPELIDFLEQIFTNLSAKRQIHLNSVTQLAESLMQLRMKFDAAYPISGDEMQRRLHLIKLLIAYNLHDIGDLPVEIPFSLIETAETSRRREEIQRGDWISSGPYAAEKFDAPIRGHIIVQALLANFRQNATLPQKMIIRELDLPEKISNPLSPEEIALLDLIDLVAFHHHEYYDGKGWPRGIQLNPKNTTLDVTFFDFIAGWFVNKSTRGANPRKIEASTPAQVLEAIDKRQAESLRRTPDGEPMYNRFWVEFMREHLDEVNEVVGGIFPDVAKKLGILSDTD